MDDYHVTIYVHATSNIEKTLTSIEQFDCDLTRVGLLVISDSEHYVRNRNIVQESKFKDEFKLCCEIGSNKLSDYSKRSNADRHFILKIKEGISFPPSTLKKLLLWSKIGKRGYTDSILLKKKDEVYIDAFNADNIYDPFQFTSIGSHLINSDIIQIDYTGLNCFMTEYENYMISNELNPDKNFPLLLRQEGFENWIDTSIILKNEYIVDEASVIRIEKENDCWRIK